jgi:glutaminyl-tRNA synthetase
MGVFDPVKVTITNWENGVEILPIENNPEDETSGTRMVPFSGELFIEREDFREEANAKYHRLKLGGEVRLKGAYVIKANEVVKNSNGEVIEIKCTYDPLSKSGMELGRKIKGTIHWVSASHGVKMKVNEYDRLFTNPEPDKGEEGFIFFLNPNSLVVNEEAIFEPAVSDCKVGVPVQMMRKGYYVLDNDGMSFNKTVSLKEGWVG